MIAKAEAFAKERHNTQVRKYTGEPYWYHLRNVAGLVISARQPDETIAAAWLHDVVEDGWATIHEIETEFGKGVASLVWWLTDTTSCAGNRRQRKTLDRDRLLRAPYAAKTIKLADLIDNTSSIVEHDPKFARVYLEEKAALLPALASGDVTLLTKAEFVLYGAQRKIFDMDNQ